MLIDGVKCSKHTHLKHFTLNAVKNFINSFPNISWVNWSLEGQKSLYEGHCSSLPSPKSAYGMKHNASIIGEYTGILLLNQCRWIGILNFEWLFWHTAKWHIARLHQTPIQWQIELFELAIIIKYTLYTNVFIKNNEICGWTVA